MFIAYLLIDSVYKGDQSKMDHYQEKLQSLLLHTDEGICNCLCYYVWRMRETSTGKFSYVVARTFLPPAYEVRVMFSVCPSVQGGGGEVWGEPLFSGPWSFPGE